MSNSRSVSCSPSISALDELAHEVVGRVEPALGREAVAVLEELERGGTAEREHPVAVALGAVVEHVGELRVGVADHPVAPVDEPVVVLVGGAEQPGEDADRELLRDLLDEVELAERQRPVEDRGGQLAERQLVALDRPRSEGRPDEPSQARVARRIRLEHGLARDPLFLVEVLEVRALLGREGLRVAGHRDDVGVPRHAPVALAERPVVPPDRGLAAKEDEGLVRDALGEVVVLEADVLEAQVAVEHGHRVESSRIWRVFRSE